MKKRPGTFAIIRSICAAFVGIQSNRNHDADDAHIEEVGFMPYIIMGVVMTAIFVLLVYGTVQLILANT